LLKGEVPVGVCPPEGGAPKCVSSRVFPNLKRMHEYWNTPFPLTTLFCISSLLSCFIEKEMFPWGHGKHIKLGVLPGHNAPGFFCWGEIPQNTHRNKKGVVLCSHQIAGTHIFQAHAHKGRTTTHHQAPTG